MRLAQDWQDYALLDAGDGEKLERWGDVILVRPDPQIIWHTHRDDRWRQASARYIRSASGGGRWDKPNLSSWQIAYGDLRFHIRPTNFKHTGLFPEQAVNWQWMRKRIEQAHRPIRVLNLFAYTGGATLACAAAGASVCHVDASKGMVQWARDNAALSGLAQRPIRWIVDDCKKFVEREIRRDSRYDAIIMDPPSYGRGPGGEVWKLEDCIHDLLALCAGVLSDTPLFFLLNAYTTGLSPTVMANLLSLTVAKRCPGQVSADEIGLPIHDCPLVLPCGSTALFSAVKG